MHPRRRTTRRSGWIRAPSKPQATRTRTTAPRPSTNGRSAARRRVGPAAHPATADKAAAGATAPQAPRSPVSSSPTAASRPSSHLRRSTASSRPTALRRRSRPHRAGTRRHPSRAGASRPRSSRGGASSRRRSSTASKGGGPSRALRSTGRPVAVRRPTRVRSTAGRATPIRATRPRATARPSRRARATGRRATATSSSTAPTNRAPPRATPPRSRRSPRGPGLRRAAVRRSAVRRPELRGAELRHAASYPAADAAQGGAAAGYPALPETPAATKKSKLPLILGIVVVLVAIAVGVLGFYQPGLFVTKVFDGAALQTGVTKILAEDYGLANVAGRQLRAEHQGHPGRDVHLLGATSTASRSRCPSRSRPARATTRWAGPPEPRAAHPRRRRAARGARTCSSARCCTRRSTTRVGAAGARPTSPDRTFGACTRATRSSGTATSFPSPHGGAGRRGARHGGRHPGRGARRPHPPRPAHRADAGPARRRRRPRRGARGRCTPPRRGIYGRFGYGVATRAQSVRVRRSGRRLRPGAPAVGDGAAARPDEIGPLSAALHERDRPAPAGDDHPRRDAGGVARRAGPPRPASGRWPPCTPARTATTASPWPPRARASSPPVTLQVEDLHADGAAAAAALWRFLLDVDLVGEVTRAAGPSTSPLDLLLADPRDRTVTGVEDELWLRLVDVPAALAARAFADAPPVLLGVHDPVPGDQRGRLPDRRGHGGARRAARRAGGAGAGVRRRRARDGLPRRPPPGRARRHRLVDRARPGRAGTGRRGVRHGTVVPWCGTMF